MIVVKGQKAQTAIELAIFGSILIFVLGGIIRSAVNSANQQHTFLKATRMAMEASNTTSASMSVASRNFATVLIVEDRLSVDSGKYGTIDRVPYISQGSAAHSANLFMPVDFGDSEDLPLMDVFINGKRFAFTISNFKEVTLAQSCAGAASCHVDCKGNCSADSPQFYRSPAMAAGDWEDDCIILTTTQTISCEGTPAPCPAVCTDGCEAGARGYHTVVTSDNIGCAKLHTIIDNHPLIDRWCDDGVGPLASPCPPDCAVTPVPGCNLPVADRFDLNRDGVSDVPANQREGFSWQWFDVMGFDESWRDPTPAYSIGKLRGDGGGYPSTVVSSAVSRGEGMVLPGGEGTTPKHVMVDIDGDLKQEYLMKGGTVGPGGIILSLRMQDRQNGDLDFSYDDSDKARGVLKPGLTKDVSVYTFVKDDSSPDGGTYFEIDEGKLFSGAGDTRQYSRTASKKDQVDLIERVFRLSNDTGAFCSGGTPTATANGIPNPVEACGTSPGACFTGANVELTCFDLENKLIFVRSRIEDLRGRKWITDVSEDPSIDFTGKW